MSNCPVYGSQHAKTMPYTQHIASPSTFPPSLSFARIILPIHLHPASNPSHNATPAPARTPRNATPTAPNAGIERGAAPLFRPVPVPEAALVEPVPVPVAPSDPLPVPTLVVDVPVGTPVPVEVPERVISVLEVPSSVVPADEVAPISLPLEVGKAAVPELLVTSVDVAPPDGVEERAPEVAVRYGRQWDGEGTRSDRG